MRPCNLVHPILKLRQQILDRLRRPVINHQPEFIALVSGARFRAPRQILAVGRVGGVEVATQRRANLHWLCCRIGQIQGEDVGIGTDGRLRVKVLGEGQFL